MTGIPLLLPITLSAMAMVLWAPLPRATGGWRRKPQSPRCPRYYSSMRVDSLADLVHG